MDLQRDIDPLTTKQQWIVDTYLHMFHENKPPTPYDIEMYYLMSAYRENREAYTALALLFYDGKTVAKNVPKAASLFDKAASLGCKIAQHNLGVMYMKGEGVVQSDEEAAECFRLASL